MNKLITFAILGFVLFVEGKINEERRGDDGYLFQLDLDDENCCKDHCLATKNSAKISKAVLDVIHQNGDTYEVLKTLKIIDFMSGNIVYEEFADNIKDNDYELVRYETLQQLVRRYKICKKVCKVYYELRKAIRENAANAELHINPKENGKVKIIISGNLIVLSDILTELEEQLMSDPSIDEIEFSCDTFIIDSDLFNSVWHGKIVSSVSINLIVVRDITWDVRGARGEFFAYK